ncbi:MAG: recombination protein RecR [Gemmatimonadetes bacterium]|nr:recombination protein RecR [Gemmatimonadota bacterium]MBI2403794.1 recombination protein RecR [Gemmatimonadota bacterium]MBI2535587.1 recombination protein RecR [Gemmatimonadota bacterium]MBI2614565.1 recombination protein RecR [Gemmatimonadota bacterium]MBI3082535.1 recombination protein RecR [Gemmatimonadota bacterium]
MSAIDDVAAELARLPGIGKKTATRLTYFLLKQPRSALERLAEAITALGTRVAACSVCGNWSDADPCGICADARRDAGLVCVVEEASDIAAIERSGEYRGVYHVLGGHVSPLDGIGPEDLRIDPLRARVANGGAVREVILATNASLEGEVTATYVRGVLEPHGVKVSRIALGLPVGGDLEYADGLTIARALAARREMGS